MDWSLYDIGLRDETVKLWTRMTILMLIIYNSYSLLIEWLF